MYACTHAFTFTFLPLRFMICCDRCEEWYHGDCVGITVGQGKRMEREGKEYVCPVCVDQEKQNKELREAGRCVCVCVCVCMFFMYLVVHRVQLSIAHVSLLPFLFLPTLSSPRSARQARRELAKEKEKEKKPSLPDQSPISQTPTTHPKVKQHFQ